MEKLLFDRRYFDHLYNCSYLTPEQWKTHGQVNIPIGVIYIIIGIIYVVSFIQSKSGKESNGKFVGALHSISDCHGAKRVHPKLVLQNNVFAWSNRYHRGLLQLHHEWVLLPCRSHLLHPSRFGIHRWSLFTL